ncbi:MAG TPA: metallophosphoesterase [Bacteroidales bacterium]|nr:metallophosphoesterase [Bacteroidales bacterium]
MKKSLLLFIGFALTLFVNGQTTRFILLGDIHYDRMEDHDMQWVHANKPNDISQIENYTTITRNNWVDFTAHLREQIGASHSTIKGVIQCGDLSEGLAGDLKADQMANSVVSAVEHSNLGVPWLIAKGNHDVTAGPPAKLAFDQNYLPMIRKQIGDKTVKTANYTYRVGNIAFFICDYYERKAEDPILWLDSAAKASTAKFKFVVFHEPIIPVTERCWHMYRTDEPNRQKLLQVVASNQLIALVGHLHRYSVVRRTTPWGPIIQIMTSSVISDRNEQTTNRVLTRYDPSMALESSWEPSTLEQRKAYLQAEQPFITYFKQCTLQGYGVLSIDEPSGRLELNYYGGFSQKPFDTINISDL